MARRHALIVGAGDPADPIADGLAARGWTVQRLTDDDTPIADATVADAFPDRDGFDLVVHARYPSVARRRCALAELTVDQWRAMADEPLESAIRLARNVHGDLAASSGTMIFLVPLMASAGGDGFAPMATAAEGIRILAKSLAKTWCHDGIRAHAITLDPSAFLAAADAAGMAEANSLHDPPLGRVPDLAGEVARIVDALAGDDFAALVGASLVVDGGLWMPG